MTLLSLLVPNIQSLSAAPSPGILAAATDTIPPLIESSSTFPIASTSSTLAPTPPMTPEKPPRRSTATVDESQPKEADSSPTTQPKPRTETTKGSTGGYRSDLASEFASKINALRKSQGLAALKRSGSLDSEAAGWAKHMGNAGDLSHSNVGRLVPPWAVVAENIGAGGSVSSLFSLFQDSAPHREAMLGNYTHMGVGVWVDSKGKIWTVHLFAR